MTLNLRMADSAPAQPAARPPEFIDSGEVARRLDMSRNTFLQRLSQLQDEMGFPLEIPWSRKTKKWRRQHVEDWINQQGQSDARL